MKKRFLLFPMIALLAMGCAGGSGYNTSVKLPEGGTTVQDEEQKQLILSDGFQAISSFFSSDPAVLATLPEVNGFNLQTTIDVHVNESSNYEDESGFVSREKVKVDLSGMVEAGLYVNTVAPEGGETFRCASAAKLEVKDLSLSANIDTYEKVLIEDQWEERKQKINFSVKDLDLGIYYLYDSVAETGYVLADLSSPAIIELVNSILDSVLAGNKNLETIKKTAEQMLTNNQKLVFNQPALVGLLDAYKADLDPEQDAGTISMIEQIHPIIEGDIVGYLKEHLHDLMGSIMGGGSLPVTPDSIIAIARNMLPILEPTFVEYKGEKAEEHAFGLGLHVSNSSLKKKLDIDLKQLGVTVDAGLVFVAGNRNGLPLNFVAPEFLELKVNFAMENVSVKAGVSAGLLFNEKSPFQGISQEFKEGFNKDGMDLINMIISYFG